jgi:glutathione S-transferase
MKLYWCERTRAVRAVWMMEELGVPYERVRIDIRDEQSRANPAFRAASPMGKVPALEDGAVRIWDSGAICAYLADQYPAAQLAPAIGSPDRGAYLMWLMYTNSVIEPAMGEKFAGLKPNSVSYGWAVGSRCSPRCAARWSAARGFSASASALRTCCSA